MLVLNSLLRRLLTLQRYRTVDRAVTSEVYTTERIGPKRSLTPEGFLFCEEVPLSRVGELLYAPGEIPLNPGTDGLIRVSRTEDELFAAACVASFNGKPVVNDHPPVDVTPANWKELTIGVCLNPRRGTGHDSDVILGDLLITDAAGIKDVLADKREVSAGYEADYEQTGEGLGKQTNIIGNHIALVDKGRCGPRCSIGDTSKEIQSMATLKAPRRTKLADAMAKVRKLFSDAEAEASEILAASAPEDGEDGANGDDRIHIHLHGAGAPNAGSDTKDDILPGAGAPNPDAGGDPNADLGDDPLEARFASLESGHKRLEAMIAELVEKLAPAGAPAAPPAAPADEEVTAKDALPEEVEQAQAIKTGDSVALMTSFQAVLADADILVPGFRMPTFDGAAKRKSTLDAMCQVRRSVLTHLSSTADGAELLKVAGPALDLAKGSCADIAITFRAAAGAKKMLNNAAGTRDAQRLPSAQQLKVAPKTPADLNKLYAAHYATKS